MERMRRAAAVHDLSGYGHCSLTVVLPVLAAMGVTVSPALTAYLSAHTGFPASERAVREDLSAALAGTVEHWRELGARFDAVYSGYLACEGQIASVKALIAGQPGALVLVDPVLGDHGQPYRAVTPGHCAAMRELAALADVITPNLTECALLLNEPYDHDPGEAALRGLLTRLSDGGRRSVVITGVRQGAGLVGAAALDRADGAARLLLRPEARGQYSGSGDLFAAVLLGGLLGGAGLMESAERAVAFVADCAALSAQAGASERDGIVFEPLLGRLIG